MNKIIKVIVIMSLLLILSYLCFINSVQATSENICNIYSIGECGSLLKYKGIVVKTYYAEYNKDGITYPAYCLDKTKQGVTNNLSYSVNVQEAIKEVGLWKRIIHGYPYVSYQELGCANKKEAFTATKQAIYCYIHGNRIEDYEPIGEAGQRTINALKKIVNDSNNSNITAPSNMINIIKESKEWQLDEKNREYVYKIYSVKSETSISNYDVKIQDSSENILLVNLDNNNQNKFSPNEKFKILMPIKNMKEDGEFVISVKADVETKPVLYGRASNNSYQDYALTMASFEEGSGEAKDTYSINETKLQIIKKDEESNSPMEGVEFAILDENKDVLYKNLKTDCEGKIILNNLIPGKYYIQEQNTLDGYEKIEQLVEVNIDWMEEFTVVINNRKTEQPKIEKTNKSISTTTEVKRLPKTGM